MVSGQDLNTKLTGWSNMLGAMRPMAELLGESAGIKAVRDKLRRLIERHHELRRVPPVLIEGETGTGKGLLARIIHRAGPRPDGPFVDVNCAAIPETLLEAEMFGFERGAFTDARRAKPGLFQTAHRGTIFLDEVGLLPEALQAKLLKVLEERTVRRLGSTRDEAVDVWIVTATNEALRTAVRERRFERTSTTGWPSSRSRCRRCASAARTSGRWPTTSSKARARTTASRPRRSPRPRTPRSWRTPGRAMCASSPTSWSGSRSCHPSRR